MEFSNYCFDTLCVQGSPEAKVWLDRGTMFGIEGEKFSENKLRHSKKNSRSGA